MPTCYDLCSRFGFLFVCCLFVFGFYFTNYDDTVSVVICSLVPDGLEVIAVTFLFSPLQPNTYADINYVIRYFQLRYILHPFIGPKH